MDQETFTETMPAFRHRLPFKPFTVALDNGDRHEVDRPETLAPGDVPVLFDHEGVSQVIGDLSGRGAEAG